MSSAEAAQPTPKQERMVALDVLRGFTMFWIIGSDSFHEALRSISSTGVVGFLARQFRHPSWEGFVFYDLIFPMFIFIIGVSIVFSLQKHLAQEGKTAAYLRIFRRFALLFLLGVIYDEGFDKLYKLQDGMRVLDENMLCGVLQRLALCYLFGSLLFLNLRTRGLVITFVAINAVYWGLLTFVKAPDQEQLSWKRGENIIHYIDRHIPPYGGTDPESIATTPPAITTCLIGILAALFLQNKSYTDKQRVLYFIAVGAAFTLTGYVWGHFGGYPIIKRLWTTTYVLVAGGYSLMLFGLFYYVIDILKVRWWIAPFLWIGANPLTIYMATNIIDFDALARRFAGGPIMEALGRYGLLVNSLVAIGLCLLLVRFLYHRKIFLRV